LKSGLEQTLVKVLKQVLPFEVKFREDFKYRNEKANMFIKELKKYFKPKLSLDEVGELYDLLCGYYNVSTPKIQLDPNIRADGTYYPKKGTIKFKEDNPRLSTVLHELFHHFNREEVGITRFSLDALNNILSLPQDMLLVEETTEGMIVDLLDYLKHRKNKKIFHALSMGETDLFRSKEGVKGGDLHGRKG